ncbi:MAG: DUF3891 family protein [Verrucomicrobiales bacterium]|nr:DUF3891 family protein [Verrucomicrobiales bacterium]
MLKTEKNNRIWLVTQPDHGLLAGTLATHWGNRRFHRLGEFTSVENPAKLRLQAVFAIAQHDNGWLEWEAEPGLSRSDHLPADLSEMVRDQQDGMNRWRIGLRRFPDASYANLLISEHPRLLYGIRKTAAPEPVHVHPLFWRARPEALLPGSENAVDAFLDELEQMQSGWRRTLAGDEETRNWIEPESLRPHVRMLQILDGLSLALTSSLIPARSGESRGLGRDAFELREVPRTSWGDRVTIDFLPVSENSVVLDPYPFDLDPLRVRVPVRVFDRNDRSDEPFQTRWYATSPELLDFRIGSSAARL